MKGKGHVMQISIINKGMQSKALYKPGKECGQEVHAVVCFQLEDAQQEVRRQFDSKAEI